MSTVDLGDQQVPVENIQRLRNGDDGRDVQRLIRSDKGKRAAAFMTGNLVQSFLTAGTPSQQAKAAEVLSEITTNLQGATTMGQPQPQEIILPATYTPEPEPAPTDYEIPADLAALLDEPDDDFEADEPEPIAEVSDTPDGEYVDPEVLRLRAQLAKTQKQADHERKLRVQTARGGWETEAATVFRLGDVPLLEETEIKGIRADSKREFMRQARTLADRNKTVALRFQPAGAPAAAAPPAAETWGAPPTAGPAVPMPSVGANPRLDRARRNGNLTEIMRARLYPEGT